MGVSLRAILIRFPVFLFYSSMYQFGKFDTDSHVKG